MIHRRHGWLAAALGAWIAGAAAAGQQGANRDAQLAAEFVRRAEAYVALHEKLEDTLPRLPRDASPGEIDRHQRALGRLIEDARPRAEPGNIFSKEIRAYFRRQLIRGFSGAEGRRLRASIMDENPGPIRLRVNGRYPDTVPLSNMPPSVLAVLPTLPLPLEYRFIGRQLILLDVDAHVIVDFIENALPR